MKIELIYEETCPNVEAARNQLKTALEQAGLEPAWLEWEVSDPRAPEYSRQYGSPTILVDERDVSGLQPGDCCDNCRIYTDDKGALQVVPSLHRIVSALTD